MKRVLLSNRQRVQRGLPFVDLLMVVAVVAVCAALQWRELEVSLNKAVLVEAFNMIRPAQYEWMEHYAETGSLEGASTVVPTGTSPQAARTQRIASVRDLEEVQAVVSRAAEPLPEDIMPRRRSKTAGNTVIDVSDGVPTAVVLAPGMDRPRLIEFRPAVAAEHPAVVNWLCGKQAPMKGMTAKPAREPAVADQFLPLACRVTL